MEEREEVMDVANILESISLIIAAWAVIIGVNAWRREYIGKRRLELAEEVLSLFYEARDIIRYIRNPFGYIGRGVHVMQLPMNCLRKSKSMTTHISSLKGITNVKTCLTSFTLCDTATWHNLGKIRLNLLTTYIR